MGLKLGAMTTERAGMGALFNRPPPPKGTEEVNFRAPLRNVKIIYAPGNGTFFFQEGEVSIRKERKAYGAGSPQRASAQPRRAPPDGSDRTLRWVSVGTDAIH